MNESTEESPKKSAKQLEKEAKKLAKLDKFKQKQKQKNIKQNIVLNEMKGKKKGVVKEAIEYTGNTKTGDKKDVSIEMPKAYCPSFVEAAWYSWWEKEGFFKPQYGRKSLKDNAKEKFVMVIPPPNITGTLHVGHALTNSIEDALTRWNRMRGRLTLWNPGCDHAGIATQVVVEKKLWRECKKTRHDVGREEFIKKIREWKNEKGDRIYKQLRKLGSSLDWDRARFTMDERCSKAVNAAFIELHESGDIYRSNRLVNWSCTLKSAISDIEVDKVELAGRTFLSIPGYENKIEFGVLVNFAYDIDQGDDPNAEKHSVVVATTRIETMLGDTAVAIHPNDIRYKHLHGKYVKHPFCDRRMPIVCDEFVEMNFGTGAVKITPAHDPNDYEVGKRHNLPFITIFSDDGKIIGDCNKFVGMKRFDARKAVIEALKVRGLFKEIKDNPMVVPICNRSKDIVEPLIKPQWYVKCDEMAKKAMEAVRKGELKIMPENNVKIWNHWMENIRDWCISRQLWWGHRIPAYRVFTSDPSQKAKFEQEEFWISAYNKEEAKGKATEKFNLSTGEVELEQDTDVLDTWFSSGLFPFSVFGWPDKTEELEIFYPNTLLETGHDILFFWVARMVFLGQRLLNKLPFREVFLHPMVRDAHGRKMSKSLGNVVDPMDVIRGITLEKLHEQLYDSNLDPKEIERAKEGQKQDYPNGIPECGTDALRFALCAYMSQARDINLDILRVQGYRFFCNKLWNAVRFARDYLINFTPANISTVSVNSCQNTYQHAAASVIEIYRSRITKNSFVKCSAKESNSLAAFNEHFANFSYVNSYQLSNHDFNLLSALSACGDGNDKCETYPYLQRWKKHVEYHRRITNRKSRESNQINLWILSRLAAAVETCNKGFENYDFNSVTTACYNLWLYEICDVYLECLKPMFTVGDEKMKLRAKQTLVYVLDCALRLLSPFMPYITEELYQRLPIYKPAPSITVAAYPSTENHNKWRNEVIEQQVQFVQQIVHSLRSAQTDYNLPKSKPILRHDDEGKTGDEKQEAEAFVCCTNDDLTSILSNFNMEIKTLAQWNRMKINETPPLGCAISTISDKCQIHISLKGSIDVEKELQKLKKNEESVIQSISKLEKAMNAPSYESKVPAEVKLANAEKLTQLRGELSKLEDAEKKLIRAINSISLAT